MDVIDWKRQNPPCFHSTSPVDSLGLSPRMGLIIEHDPTKIHSEEHKSPEHIFLAVCPESIQHFPHSLTFRPTTKWAILKD